MLALETYADDGRIRKPANDQSSKLDATAISFVMTGSRDKTIKLWDAQAGHCLWTFVSLLPAFVLPVLNESTDPDGPWRLGASSRFSSVGKVSSFSGRRQYNALLGSKDWAMRQER